MNVIDRSDREHLERIGGLLIAATKTGWDVVTISNRHVEIDVDVDKIDRLIEALKRAKDFMDPGF